MGAGAGLRAGFHHVFERGVDIEVFRAEGVRRRQQDHRRVAAHHVGDVVGRGPARIPAALDCVVDQRLHHVAFDCGIEERLKLDGVAIDVPVGEVGVLHRLALAGEGVNLAVEAGVIPVDIAEDVGRQEGVIDAGVEDGALIGSAAFDHGAVEQPGPYAARGAVEPIEVPAADLLLEVVASAGFADKGNADFEPDLVLLAEIEPGAGVLALGRGHIGVDGVVLPHSGADERLVEAARDVDLVVGVGPAEAAGARPARECAVGPDQDVACRMNRDRGAWSPCRGWSWRCCRHLPGCGHPRLPER